MLSTEYLSTQAEKEAKRLHRVLANRASARRTIHRRQVKCIMSCQHELILCCILWNQLEKDVAHLVIEVIIVYGTSDSMGDILP